MFPLYRGTHGNGWEHMPTLKPVTTIHRACGQPTITALTGDRCGYIVCVDAALLSAVGEVAALTAGRHTYLARGRYLDPRDRWNISGRPPGHDRPVHVEHDCTPIPGTWLLSALPIPAPTILTSEVPF